MKRNLTSLLAVFLLSLTGCSSGESPATQDAADFFTKLSQGYRIQDRSLMPADAMWTSVGLKKLSGMDEFEWPMSVAQLTGYIMQNKGVMDGPLFLLFRIEGGEIQGEVMLCQPVENVVTESETIHAISEPVRKVIRTTHTGKRKKLGTAFRVLEAFAVNEDLETSGWATVRVLRGSIDETDSSKYLTEAQLYLK
jgi:hypothetical protein